MKTDSIFRALVLASSAVFFACSSGTGSDDDANEDASEDVADAVSDAADVGDTAADGDESDAADVSDASDDAEAGVTDASDTAEVDAADADVGIDNTPDDNRSTIGDVPESLPLDLAREDVGEPMSADALTAFTEEYVALLEDISYFRHLADRIHGVPETDPEGRYWYGTWWSGVSVERSGDRVIFRHGADGADNNGLRTPQVLESACFAYSLWERPEDEALIREILRGYISWAYAMESEGNAEAGLLLTRASYPESIVAPERGMEVEIDYSLNRPGEDNGATIYVRVPDNPYWGDVWIKNKRSKDDVGHMFRGLGSMQACADLLGEDASAELEEAYEIYFAFARRVQDDLDRIATYDEDLNVYFPNEDLAFYIDLPGIECPHRLLMRLAGRGYTGDIECGSGVGPGDRALTEIRNSNAQIMRSHHIAAVLHALLANRPDVAEPLLGGVIERIDWYVDAVVAGEVPDYVEPRDFATLLIHGANAGVPLTSQEVRWLHEQVRVAAEAYRGMDPAVWDIFGADTPDGNYPYQVNAPGIFINDLGLLLGYCASPWINPNGQPLLDCATL